MLVDADWTPTAENIESLPDPLRRYIHDLHTRADPGGLMRENFTLRQENNYLRRECERLASLARLSDGKDASGLVKPRDQVPAPHK